MNIEGNGGSPRLPNNNPPDDAEPRPPEHSAGQLEPDEEQIAMYVGALYCRADPGSYVHLKVLRDDEDGPWAPKSWSSVPINGSLDPVTDEAFVLALKAVRAREKVVFAPPVATFKGPKGSREKDVANGLTITVDLDANPLAGLHTLEAVLGPATLIVKSGGKWVDPETNEVFPKLHVHWRLSEPTRTPDEHRMLKAARVLAKAVAHADGSAIPINHPLRCAGSWHRKAEPVLARIDADGYRPDVEIELCDALARLRAAGANGCLHFTPSPPHSPIPPLAAVDFEAHTDLLAVLPAPLLSRIQKPPAPDSDRSEDVWSLVNALRARDLSRDEMIGIFRRFPDGPALSKYGDRLELEIDRILEKLWSQDEGRKAIAQDAVWDAGDDFELPPPRAWLLANSSCRRCLSCLFASGGKGKTALRLVQALSVATGRSLTGERVIKRGKVLFVSLEDDRDELRRRVHAAMIYHKISPEELKGWFYEATPIGKKLAKDKTTPGELDAWLREKIKRHQIDLVCIDPLVKTHNFDENDNAALDFVCTLLTRIAHDRNCAVDVLHHEGKGNSGQAGDANRGRGATAIKDAARLCFTLTSMMSEQEQKLFNVSPDEARHLIRLDPAKINILPPATNTRWFRLVGVQLDNGTPDYPKGDAVQTVEVWTPPNIWADVTDDKAKAILDDIDRGLDNGSRYSSAPQAGSRAAWKVVQRHVPAYSEPQAKKLINDWEESGILKMEPYTDPSRREERKGLVVHDEKRRGRTSPGNL
jgi:AAA domain-containing protein